jgi:hypothetical protein
VAANALQSTWRPYATLTNASLSCSLPIFWKKYAVAAEEADLSVSQIVRRAIRNELKLIAREKAAPDTRITLDYVGRVFEAAAKSGLLTGGVIPGIDSAFDAKKIVRKRPR